MKLRVLSQNIHKGASTFSLKDVKSELRTLMRSTHADLVFLQEVRGTFAREEAMADQFEYLADEVWKHYAYGKNAVYPGGDHGNAILSHYPIEEWSNFDLSLSKLEKRGLLYAKVHPEKSRTPLHCFSLHLNLFAADRRKQLKRVIEVIQEIDPRGTGKLVIAGDFNDWNEELTEVFEKSLGCTEAFVAMNGRSPKTFPAWLPMLRLDRIYVRGFDVIGAEVLTPRKRLHSSDHLGIVAEIKWT